MRINKISQTSFQSENTRGRMLLEGLNKNPNAFYERPIEVKLDIIYEKLRQADKERNIINENLKRINENNSFAAKVFADYQDASRIDSRFSNNTPRSFVRIG